MVLIYINKNNKIEIPYTNVDTIVKNITEATTLLPGEFFLEQNGKRLHDQADHGIPVYVCLCVLGGKGGFGSMLRAIGAQIEKTTNRESCRDLSGRRLRDINEEKRLKAWLEKQSEREREADEKKKRKIKNLLAVPKHEFNDIDYEESRSKLSEKVCDAVEEGFKKTNCFVGSDLKRKRKMTYEDVKAKKAKTALWIDDDLSSDLSDEDDEHYSNNSKYELNKKKDDSENSTESKSSKNDKNPVCNFVSNNKF